MILYIDSVLKACIFGCLGIHFGSPFLLLDNTDQPWKCPPGVPSSKTVFTYRRTCIQFVIGHPRYWDDARTYCHSHGGYLVSIPDSKTQQFLMYVLTSLKYDGTALWIGLNDRLVEGTWRWDTGYHLHDYSNWDTGEPATLLSTFSDCVAIQYDKGGRWHDKACHLWPEYFDFICQYDMIPVPTTTHTTSTTSTKPITTTPITSPSTTKRTTPTTTPTTATTTTTKTTSSSPLRVTSAPFTTVTPETPVTTRSMTSQIVSGTSAKTTSRCQDVNCVQTCPNGYSGVVVGTDGCIECKCN